MRAMILLMLALPAHASDKALLDAVVQCESSGRHTVHGKVMCGDDGISCGIAQFQRETFYEFARDAKKEWPFGKPRWLDKEQQLWLMNWAIDHGHGRRWTCYRKLKGERNGK